MRTRIIAVVATVIAVLVGVMLPAEAAAKRTVTLYALQTGTCGGPDGYVNRVLSPKMSNTRQECGGSFIVVPGSPTNNTLFEVDERYPTPKSFKKRAPKSGGYVTGSVYIRSAQLVTFGDEVPNREQLDEGLVGYADVTVGLKINGRSIGQTQGAGLLLPTMPLKIDLRMKLPKALYGKVINKVELTVKRNTSVGLTVVSMSPSEISTIKVPVA